MCLDPGECRSPYYDVVCLWAVDNEELAIYHRFLWANAEGDGQSDTIDQLDQVPRETEQRRYLPIDLAVIYSHFSEGIGKDYVYRTSHVDQYSHTS